MDLTKRVNPSYFDDSCSFVFEPVTNSSLIENTKLESSYDWGKLFYGLSEGSISEKAGRFLADIVSFDSHTFGFHLNSHNIFIETYSSIENIKELDDRLRFTMLYFSDIYRKLVTGLYLEDLSLECYAEKHNISLDECKFIQRNLLLTIKNKFLSYILSGSSPSSYLFLSNDIRIPTEILTILLSRGYFTSTRLYDVLSYCPDKYKSIKELKRIGFSENTQGLLNVESVLNILIDLGYAPHLRKYEKSPNPIKLTQKEDK